MKFLLAVFTFCLVITSTVHPQNRDNVGSEFYIAFAYTEGADVSSPDPETYKAQLFITSDKRTTFTVECPAADYKETGIVEAGFITMIDLPYGQQRFSNSSVVMD